ncbi:hypothetical protein [Tatumella punctata]|uniref:Uncharacterized protein n=1 Tax=Tatumella punctata TaxID=399969 RepID=A0ABW1VTK3_9GAMM
MAYRFDGKQKIVSIDIFLLFHFLLHNNAVMRPEAMVLRCIPAVWLQDAAHHTVVLPH